MAFFLSNPNDKNVATCSRIDNVSWWMSRLDVLCLACIVRGVIRVAGLSGGNDTSRVYITPASSVPKSNRHLGNPGSFRHHKLAIMREIVHMQAGQCGNQIGAKVSHTGEKGIFSYFIFSCICQISPIGRETLFIYLNQISKSWTSSEFSIRDRLSPHICQVCAIKREPPIRYISEISIFLSILETRIKIKVILDKTF